MDISLVIIVALGLVVIVGLWLLVISPLMSKREFIPYFKGWLFDDELDDNHVFMGGIYNDVANTRAADVAIAQVAPEVKVETVAPKQTKRKTQKTEAKKPAASKKQKAVVISKDKVDVTPKAQKPKTQKTSSPASTKSRAKVKTKVKAQK